MEFLERVLAERSAEIADLLRLVGFSPEEARRFLDEAGPQLLRAYAWRVEAGAARGLPGPGDAGDLLAVMPGRALAARVGLPTAKAWAGLREMVPAVLEASSPIGG